MVDVRSVVANLKLTTKGKLVYNEKNWNTVLNETSSVPRLHVPSFVVKDTSRLVVNKKNENRKDISDYKNYFSPERAEPTINSQCRKVQPKELPLDKHKHVDTSAAVGFDRTLSTLSPNDNHLLHDVNKEYNEALKSLSNMRLVHMKSHMLHFQDEYQNRLEAIDQNLYEKYQHRHQKVLNQQNSSDNTEELSYYDDVKRRREQLAKEKAEQTQAKLQQIQAKRKQLDDHRKALLEKKRALGKLAEAVSQTLTNTVRDYKQYKESGHAPPNGYTQVVNQMISDYQACTGLVSAVMDKEAAELDRALQFVTNKLEGMEECSKRCKDILQKLKAENEALEKRKNEEAEAKAKVSAASTATTTTPANTSVPNTTSQAPPPAYTALSTSVTQQQQQQQASTAPSGPVPSIEEAVPALIPLKNAISGSLHLLSFKPAFNSYLQLQKLLSDTEKIHAPISLSKDKAIKTYKFDLYKVVNTQINAISDESPKHLMEKIMKLNNLLNEGDVMFSGKKVTVKGSPKALALVKDLIAKKLVLQGQSQVASSFKAAFPIAAVCVGLWSLFPDFGDLLLGHFYNKCPFLVPFYVPKIESISTVEYCKLVGYDVDGETVEDEDKYLSKLSGTVRLYAAMMQMDMPPQLSSRPHPFSIEHGWIWFTRLMNLEPRPSVTATMIFDFLEVAGHALMKRFGKQFQKVLLTLCRELMPKILEVTPANSKAGAMRLKMFLETCVKEGKIKPPDGMLTARWWSSTGH